VANGAAEANALGLTTQVPVREVYLTSGQVDVFGLAPRRSSSATHPQLARAARKVEAAQRRTCGRDCYDDRFGDIDDAVPGNRDQSDVIARAPGRGAAFGADDPIHTEPDPGTVVDEYARPPKRCRGADRAP